MAEGTGRERGNSSARAALIPLPLGMSELLLVGTRPIRDRDQGLYSGYFTDPEGNGWEVV